MEKIRIGVAEDHEVLRKGLGTLLEKLPRFEIILSVGDGQQLLDEMNGKIPDVVILDIEMPHLNGFDTLKLLKTNYPDVRVIMYSFHFCALHIRECISLGASAFVSKSCDFELLKSTIVGAYERGFYYCEKVLKFIDGAHTWTNGITIESGTYFCNQEIQVLKLLMFNLTNEQVAAVSKLSVRTVEGYRQSLMRKMGVNNLAAAAKFAIQNQILSSLSLPYTKPSESN